MDLRPPGTQPGEWLPPHCAAVQAFGAGEVRVEPASLFRRTTGTVGQCSRPGTLLESVFVGECPVGKSPWMWTLPREALQRPPGHQATLGPNPATLLAGA